MSRRYRFALTVVMLSVVACNRGPRMEAPSSVATSAKPVATLTSDELVAEYQKNPLAADQKYKGQLLQVSGKVGKIGKSIMGHPFVSLGTGGEEDLFGVTCYLAPASVDEAVKLQPGAMVKIRGSCMGQYAGQALRLQDCEFVK